MSTIFEVVEELRNGGEWLGATREWMKSNVSHGDTITWGSAEPVQLPFYKLEELALRAAVAAVTADRVKRGRPATKNSIFGDATPPIEVTEWPAL